MTDKLFTKRLRDLTDEAIRESLAEISVEFEKRFGSAALTASPPVVEREAIARIIDPREWDEAESYRVRADEWFAKGRTKPGDALTDGHRRKADEMQARLLTKADAILALTPVEGVGERAALERIASAKLVPEKYGDQTPLRCQSCAYRGHVTGEERHSENCPRQIALAALATLTKGARDAG